MPSILFWPLILLIVLLTVTYILGPILVRFTARVSPNPTFDEIPDEHARALFPPNFFSTINELETLGFSLACHLSSSTQAPNLHAVLSLLVNRETKTICLITFARSLAPGASHISVNYVEFSSYFEDGSEINTVNNATVRVFYPLRNKVIVKVRHLKDTGALYQVHLYMARKHPGRAVLPEPGKEIEHLSQNIKEALAQQAQLGYYFLDEKKQCYRLTWKAAFRTTWRLLWPAKQILQRQEEQEGRRIAAEAAAAGYTQ